MCSSAASCLLIFSSSHLHHTLPSRGKLASNLPRQTEKKRKKEVNTRPSRGGYLKVFRHNCSLLLFARTVVCTSDARFTEISVNCHPLLSVVSPSGSAPPQPAAAAHGALCLSCAEAWDSGSQIMLSSGWSVSNPLPGKAQEGGRLPWCVCVCVWFESVIFGYTPFFSGRDARSSRTVLASPASFAGWGLVVWIKD